MSRWSMVVLAGLVLAATGCAADERESPPVAPADGEMIAVTVPAPSLADNLLGDPAEREVLVYLPPSYAVTEQRYPVVYYLAGYREDVGAFRPFREVVWEQMLADGGRELIIVEVDGVNALGGNFYANSPVTGDAEDFLVEDLVGYVDRTYRTVAAPSGRGLSGFSMGGSGTINVGLAHPETFGALYANSPGLLRDGDGLASFLRSNGNWAPYGATFAPDPDAEYPHFRSIDTRTPLAEQDPELVAAWESGYGDLRGKLTAYLARPDRLAEIRIAYGTRDAYPWIPEGCAWFVELLEENGVAVSTVVTDGPHAVDAGFFEADFVDFFSRTLAG